MGWSRVGLFEWGGPRAGIVSGVGLRAGIFSGVVPGRVFLVGWSQGRYF